MKTFLIVACAALVLAGCRGQDTNPAAARQANATRRNMDQADRQIGMPRITNYAQRKLLKNAYEDMDQTTLTYVYTQSMDGLYVCLGQAVGYGISLGTQFTPPTYPQRIRTEGGEGAATDVGIYEQGQPEPNGLYMPDSGDATIVNLIDAQTGVAHTAVMEPDVITIPARLPAAVVKVQCPSDVDAAKVKDAKETSLVPQRN